MDQLFGDATTAMPTPAQEAEVESLMSASRSPVPSLDIRRGPGTFTAENAIPGLDINPPKDGEDQDGHAKKPDGGDANGSGSGEGIGGWISRMVKRGGGRKAGAANAKDAGSYRRLGQDDERGDE